jgi:hypothetical protein
MLARRALVYQTLVSGSPRSNTDSFQQLVGRASISAAEFARRQAAAFAPG